VSKTRTRRRATPAARPFLNSSDGLRSLRRLFQSSIRSASSPREPTMASGRARSGRRRRACVDSACSCQCGADAAGSGPLLVQRLLNDSRRPCLCRACLAIDRQGLGDTAWRSSADVQRVARPSGHEFFCQVRAAHRPLSGPLWSGLCPRTAAHGGAHRVRCPR